MKNLLLSITFSFLSIALVAQVSQKEEQALLDMFSALNGENWIHTWDINEPVSNWHGITVKKNKVTEINLLFNNLEGVLPSSIGDLKNLTYLELSFNKIHGALPTEIGLLSNLEFLAINTNQLDGSIPASINTLKSLKALHLSSNKLGGTVPAEFSNLSNLEIFNVFDNSITGELPAAFSTSKKLKKVVIAQNKITKNKAIASVTLFDYDTNNPNFKTGILPSASTVIAIESSEDN